MEQAQLLAYAAAAVAALAGGIVLIVKKHRTTGIGLVLVGSFLVLLPVGLIGYTFVVTPSSDEVWVNALSDSNPDFTVDLRNRPHGVSGDTYAFTAKGPPADIVATFEHQHPGGEENPHVADQDGLTPLWRYVDSDISFTLYGDESSYELVSERAYLHGASTTAIPFPTELSKSNFLEIGKPFPAAWSTDQWAEFYGSMSQAQISVDTISIPTSGGRVATITLDEGTATVTVNPQPR